MEIDAAIYGRRSVRECTSQAIDEKAIQKPIDGALRAPNAVNLQPWTFTVVRDQAVPKIA